MTYKNINITILKITNQTKVSSRPLITTHKQSLVWLIDIKYQQQTPCTRLVFETSIVLNVSSDASLSSLHQIRNLNKLRRAYTKSHAALHTTECL